MWGLLFFIGWLGIFALSLGGAFLGVAPWFIKDFNGFETMEYKVTVILIAIFYFILFLKKAWSLFETKEEESYIIETDKGTIAITLSSINNMIKGVVRKQSYIKENKIRSVIGKEGVSVKLKIGVQSIDDLNEEMKKTQDLIISYVLKVAGITINAVNITVYKVEHSETENLPE